MLYKPLLLLLILCFMSVYLCLNDVVRISRHPYMFFFVRSKFIDDFKYNYNNIKVRSRRLLGPSTHLTFIVKVYHEYKLVDCQIIYNEICMKHDMYIKLIVKKILNYHDLSEKLMDSNSAIRLSITKKNIISTVHRYTFKPNLTKN